MKLFKPTSWLFWISLALIFSIIHFFIYLNYHGLDIDMPFMKVGDAFDYITSTKSFINNGEYVFFKTTEWQDRSFLVDIEGYDKSLYYAYRSPGYSFIMYPLFLYFTYNKALIILIILQVLFFSIAKYLLCLISLNLFQSKKIFYAMFILINLSLDASFWNIYIYTESFAISFLIGSIYCLLNGIDKKNIVLIFFSGLFLTESVFLRPFLAPLFLPFIILLIYSFGFKKSLLYCFIYISSFIVIDGLWTIRNYRKTGELIPLASTMNYHKYMNKAFVKHFEIYTDMGLPFSFYNWFYIKNDKREAKEVFSNGFIVDDESNYIMKEAKEEYLLSKNDSVPKVKRAFYEKSSIEKQDKLHKEYKKKHPYLWLETRFTILKVMLKPEIYSFFPSHVLLNQTSLLFQSLLNRFVYLFGFISCFVALYRFRKETRTLVILAVPLFISFFFIMILSNTDIREMFIPSFFMGLFSVELMYHLFKNKKYLTWIPIIASLIVISLFDTGLFY